MVLSSHQIFRHIKSFFQEREITTQGEQQFLQWRALTNAETSQVNMCIFPVLFVRSFQLHVFTGGEGWWSKWSYKGIRGPAFATSPSLSLCRGVPLPALLFAPLDHVGTGTRVVLRWTRQSTWTYSEIIPQYKKEKEKVSRFSAGSAFLLCISGHVPGLQCQGCGGWWHRAQCFFQQQSWLKYK